MKKLAATLAIATACTLSATAIAKTYSQTGQVQGSPGSSVSLKVKVSGKGVIKKVVGFSATDVLVECKRSGARALSFESISASTVDKKTKKFSGGDQNFRVEGKVKKKGKKVTGTISAAPFYTVEGGLDNCSLRETKFATS